MLHFSLIALGVIHFLFFHLSFALLSRNTSIPRTFLSYIPLRTHIVKMNFASTKIIFCITEAGTGGQFYSLNAAMNLELPDLPYLGELLPEGDEGTSALPLDQIASKSNILNVYKLMDLEDAYRDINDLPSMETRMKVKNRNDMH